MSCYKEIGGYFGLELSETDSFIHKNSILLNTARNCFEYILKANNIKKIYIPTYNCEVMLEPLKKTNTEYKFYSINKNFDISSELTLKEDEYLLYINYFGIKDYYIKELTKKYNNKLIIDNSQAFYSKPELNISTFYSPRKFFGVSDGGCLYTNKKMHENFETDYSYERFSHLLKRTDICAEAGYEDFKKNEMALNNQDIKYMSKLTLKILNSIDYQKVKDIRLKNFNYLHSILKEKNELNISSDYITCPMVYPFLIENENLRKKLIDNKIFIATYWPNVYEWAKPKDNEYYLAKYLLPLPIDQRYTDMERIIEVINE